MMERCFESTKMLYLLEIVRIIEDNWKYEWNGQLIFSPMSRIVTQPSFWFVQIEFENFIHLVIIFNEQQ